MVSLWSIGALIVLYFGNYMASHILRLMPMYSDVAYITFLLQLWMNNREVKDEDALKSFPVASVVGALIFIPAILTEHSPIVAELLMQLMFCSQMLKFVDWKPLKSEKLVAISVAMTCVLFALLYAVFAVVLHWTIYITIVVYVALVWWSKTNAETSNWMEHVQVEDLFYYWCTVRVSGWCIQRFLPYTIETSNFVVVMVVFIYTLFSSLKKFPLTSYAAGVWCLIVDPAAAVCGIAAYIVHPSIGVALCAVSVYMAGISLQTIWTVLHAMCVWYFIDHAQQHAKLKRLFEIDEPDVWSFLTAITLLIPMLPELLDAGRVAVQYPTVEGINFTYPTVMLIGCTLTLLCSLAVKTWFSKQWLKFLSRDKYGYQPLSYTLPMMLVLLLQPMPLQIPRLHKYLLIAWRIVIGYVVCMVAIVKTIQLRRKRVEPSKKSD